MKARWISFYVMGACFGALFSHFLGAPGAEGFWILPVMAMMFCGIILFCESEP